MSTADQVIANKIKRADRAAAVAQAAKKRSKTPVNKQTHYIGNEDVHDQNNSGRQADAVEDIDRDSELPETWKKPSQLDAPDPRPGFANKWVRFRSGNSEDMDNLDKYMSQGWRPVSRSTAKKVHALTANSDSKFGQYIVKRGLILMELPEKLWAQRRAYYDAKLNQMTESIDRNLFKEQDKRMPLLTPERKTQVSLTARRVKRPVAVADDDANAST
jgi:hypothetical protein